MTEYIQGDLFVDKKGNKFTKEDQIQRIQTWLESWDTDNSSNIARCLKKVWHTHRTGSFPISELRYPIGDNKQRYISVRGLCNGHEIRGIPVLTPVRTTAKGLIKEARFSDIMRDQLQARYPAVVSRRIEYL